MYYWQTLCALALVFSITMSIFTVFGVKKNGRPVEWIWITTAVVFLVTTTWALIIILERV